MQLWDDRWEALRPTLREEADAMIAAWEKASTDPSLTLDEWAAGFRAAHVGMIHSSDQAIDRTIEGPAGPIRVRTFVPEQIDAVMLHIHGGGWVSGGPEMLDLLHETWSPMLNLAVVSVEYRLAPEDPYPAANDDCEAVAVWLLENAEKEFGASRLLIGGESAGAHLSACTLLRVRDRHDAIDRFTGANLLFGQFDHSASLPGQRRGPDHPDTLSDATLERIEECYVGGLSLDERRHPDVSPLYADLHDLPPALFAVGADDHFIDDNILMAARWQMAGNDTELVVYPEGPHACVAMPTVAADYFPRLEAFLRRSIKG